jgi:hypothetical protein
VPIPNATPSCPTLRPEPLSWTSSFRSSIMNLMRPFSAGVSRASYVLRHGL